MALPDKSEFVGVTGTEPVAPSVFRGAMSKLWDWLSGLGTAAFLDSQPDAYSSTGDIAVRGTFGWGITPGGLDRIQASDRDMNLLTTTGNYTLLPSTNSVVMAFGGGGVQNLPPESLPDTEWNVIVSSSPNIRTQVATNPGGNRWVRTYNGSSWSSWERIVTKQESVLALDNEFTGGSVRIVREDNIVTIAGTNAYSHGLNKTSYSTSTNFLPAWARPVGDDRMNVFADMFGVHQVSVNSSGRIRVHTVASSVGSGPFSIVYAID